VRSVDSNGLTALHWAVYNGPEGYARELLRAGATVDAASNVGQTPLMYAAESGHAALARLLLAHGANATAKAQDGETAFHVAASEQKRAAFDALVAHAYPSVRKRGAALLYKLYRMCELNSEPRCVDLLEADHARMPPLLLLNVAAGYGDRRQHVYGASGFGWERALRHTRRAHTAAHGGGARPRGLRQGAAARRRRHRGAH
jgi:hypothetical protein